MKSDYGVVIAFRNRDNEDVIKEYEFEQYVNTIKFELTKLIMDVENVFIEANDGKQKSEWDEHTLAAFNKIRHKLLNQANAIERLPDNLYYKGEKI